MPMHPFPPTVLFSGHFCKVKNDKEKFANYCFILLYLIKYSPSKVFSSIGYFEILINKKLYTYLWFAAITKNSFTKNVSFSLQKISKCDTIIICHIVMGQVQAYQVISEIKLIILTN